MEEKMRAKKEFAPPSLPQIDATAVARITYTVLVETLNPAHAQSITQSVPYGLRQRAQ